MRDERVCGVIYISNGQLYKVSEKKTRNKYMISF